MGWGNSPFTATRTRVMGETVFPSAITSERIRLPSLRGVEDSPLPAAEIDAFSGIRRYRWRYVFLPRILIPQASFAETHGEDHGQTAEDDDEGERKGQPYPLQAGEFPPMKIRHE
jgi:hypothetical protein